MGEETVKRYIGGVTLNEQRGSPFVFNGITCIATYAPQDAEDRRDYFSGKDEEDDENKSESTEDKTTHGKTQRRNWKFWMRQDIKKAVRLTANPLSVPTARYHYWPDISEILSLLQETKGCNFYFDIETDKHLQMTCFGFSLNEGKDVYVVPMLQTHQSTPTYYYTDTHLILRAIAVCLRNNTVVIHNSMFDLFVLVWRYGIPISSSVYDSMLSHNRCYIEVEKSLGHVISLHTDLPYHKNEGVFEPHNQQQVQQLYEYNAKDVFALTQIKPQIDATAVRLGATESVQLVNRMVVPYLTMTLQGIRLSESKIESVVDYHTRWNKQIERILYFVTNQEFNPNSWQQVSKYLYDSTFLRADGRSFKIPKPNEDPTKEETLLNLLLKFDIPAIHCILKYRGNQKRISKAAVKTKNGEPRYWIGPTVLHRQAPRVTCSWMLARTKTMRLGSTKLLKRWGDNLQNWEKMLRKEIVPDEGKVFLQIDQSGAEALIVAWLCRPGQMRDLFLTGINPHCYLGMHVFQEQFEAELGFKLSYYVQLPVKDLGRESKWAEIHKCIKASDEWPAERRYYFIAKQGNHCVDSETEVYTPNGWTSVCKCPNKIHTIDLANWKIDFEDVTWNVFNYKGFLFHFTGQKVSQAVTPNHRVVFFVHTNKGGIIACQEAAHIYEITHTVDIAGVGIGDRLQSQIKKVGYDGNVFCPFTKSGFFVIRRHGKISITGNSLNYDAKARAFRTNTLVKSEGAVALSLEQSQRVIDIRCNLFPELGDWQSKIVIELKRTKILRNLFGHPRVFTGRIEESMYKEAYAYKPQSTVGQITNYAITEMQERLEKGDELLQRAGTDVLQNNHDSMLVQCYPEFKREVSIEMRKHMNRALVNPKGEKFQMKTEVQWSEKSWGEMEEMTK